MKTLAIILLTLCSSIVAAQLPKQPSPEGAEVYFIEPADGQSLTSPVTVVFGLKGMGVAPAGAFQDVSTLKHWPNTGHHHLIINAGLPDMSLPVPADENYVHYGTGATQTELDLPPGTHTLQLILGDALHIPHDPAVISEQITITVE